MSVLRHVAPVTVAAVLAGAITLVRPGVLVELDRVAQDDAVRHTAPPATSGSVALVAVDEASLAALGQWPWPRDVVGRLVTALHEDGAAAIAFDILFSEPDRIGTPGPELGEPASTDAELAAAVARAPVAVGFALTIEGNPLASASTPCALTPLEPVQHRRGDQDLLAQVFRGDGAVCSVPVLSRAAGATGIINAAPDTDGVLRRLPLLARLNDRIYPTLALAAVHVARREALVLEPRGDGTLRLMIGPRQVILDAQGTLPLRLRGPGHTYPHISAADVLAGRVPPGTFSGRIVFVGATALGVRSVVTTAIDPRFPGVELHATVADMLLVGAGSARPEFAAAIESLSAVVAAVLASLAVAAAGAGPGAALAAIAGLASWFGARLLFGTAGVVLSPVNLLAGLVVGTAVSAAWQLARERRRASAEGLRHRQAERLIVQTLTSLTATRDEDTGRHARRTQEYVRVLATALARQPKH
ncbi:MAG TPA: CHASE2 domain-containing protein, partial [Vicinamibacterales bacterium]|nr:CHASE2 domain-containing protein [Vicinamibacterales bacterium]